MDVIHRLFTVDDIYRMLEAGILAEGERVELIEGELLTLAPHDAAHSNAIEGGTLVLVRLYGAAFKVRVQLPLELDDRSEPEPDFAVVAPDAPRGKRHPRTALLVMEVANTSLKFDRGRKALLYARSAIEYYWVLDVAARRLEVFTKPGADGYACSTVLAESDEVEAPGLEGAKVVVRDLLG